LVALAGIAACTAIMIPLREHLSLSTPALVLVVPVVAGTVVGGFGAGLVAVAAGFFAYDFFFIPPYNTLAVGRGQNWTALVVYAVVVLLVSVLVDTLRRARVEARRREEDTRRVYLLSDLLIGDQHLDELLTVLVSTIQQAFGARWVAVLLPDGDRLRVGATSGEPLADDELESLLLAPGRTERLRDASTGVVRIVLTVLDRPVGLVAMAGPPLDPHDWELLNIYANQAALALERSRLREQVVRAELLEEVDRWRDALMGAVSHDLRTPLASVKSAVTALRRPGPELSPGDRDELLGLIEDQSDALERLVTNLLDMTRIQAGTLDLRREITPVPDVVEGAMRMLGADHVVTDVPADLPPVDVDQLLMQQVLANLLDNALRHSPDTEPVRISAAVHGPVVELVVEDRGPGVPSSERELVFQMFNRASAGGRAGLGLTIAKAFVEAHGQTIRVEDAAGGGARFVVTMPVAPQPAATGPAHAA
jgi:two-component system sensor histidine kinase KdpD